MQLTPAQSSLENFCPSFQVANLPTHLCYLESVWSSKLIPGKLKIHNVFYKFSHLYVVATGV